MRTGVLAEDKMKLDYVLALKPEDFLERRLQTQVSRYLDIYRSMNIVSIFAGVQAGAGQVHPPRPCPHQAETHQSQEAGMSRAQWRQLPALLSSKSMS